MICRKCGAILPDNSIRCSNCGIKVNIVCPECKTISPFGEKYCKNCGFEFIKICPSCFSSNIYSATECRKCKTPLTPLKHSPVDNQNKNTINQKKTISNQKKQYALSEQDKYSAEVVEPISSFIPAQLNYAETTKDDSNKTKKGIKNHYFHNDIEISDDKNIEYISDIQEVEQNQIPPVQQEREEEIEYISDIQEVEQNQIPPVQQEPEEEIEYISDIQEVEQNQVPPVQQEPEEEIEYISDIQEVEQNQIPPVQQEPEKEVEYISNIQEVEQKQIPPVQQEPEEEVEYISDNSQSVNKEDKSSNIEEYISDTEETIEEEQTPQYIIQQKTVIKIIQNIKNSINKHIIAINGPEGCGKTAVINQVRNILTNDGYLCLYGSCTPLSQITSFGYFQDAILRMIGLPPYINSTEAFLRDFRKSELNNFFSFLQPHELSLFINLLYPAQKDDFENILENKQLMFSIIEKVIKMFLTNSNIVMIIDNFDLLDGASYDFITYIASKKFFNNRLKLLVAYQESKPVQNYFDLSVKDERIFATIGINKPDSQELIDTINSSTGLNLTNIIPEEYLEKIIKYSGGNAIKLEQDIAYLIDIGYIVANGNDIITNEDEKPEDEPETIEELIKLRLNILSAEIKNVLLMASIMGYRFATNILCNAVPMPVKQAENILEVLKQKLLIVPVDDYTCEFKNLTIWKYIYKEAKADPLFKDNSERLYSILKSRVLSSNIQKIISCSEALTKEEEFIIWQDTSYITAKLGDTNLYVIAQKQCLKILEEQDMPNAEKVREIIYEQIGKLLSQKSPNEAVGYLANVLDSRIKANDTNKIIDISGYFISSCYLTGNYFGVKEAVDAVISNINTTGTKIPEIDLALIKTRKLKALLNIGNTEEVIQLIKEEILIELNKEMDIKHPDTSYKNILTDAWFLSNIVLAKAYLMQGKQEVFSITATMKEFIENNKLQSGYYSSQIDIIEAFAHSTRGEINLSNDILSSVIDKYNKKPIDKKLLCELNLVSIINKIFTEQIQGLKDDLFELAAFANNINEHLIKNIAKLILGHIIKEEGDTAKALNIYNEEITYFAKEKIALGAMLSWALIVRISIDNGDIDMALNTALKALEIAESPKINNLFFIIYFQKYIAEIYRLKGDLVAVKMYLEKALMIAKQNSLRYQLVSLYIDYGKYMESYMKINQTFSEDYIKITLDMYGKACSSASELKINCLIRKANKERAGFKRFCQLNSIEI